MKNLVISQAILEKLRDKHGGISRQDVEECFLNRDRSYLIDDREGHINDDPPTEWFISETDKGRKLLVAFIFRDGNVFLRTCFPPNERRQALYLQKSEPI